jgi:RsiW-degrading membrane proteinase PrsW (M82 family)
MADPSPAFLVVLVVSAFALPLVFMAWIRNTARYGREPWHLVLQTFLWGAVFSVIITVVVSLIFLAILGNVESLTQYVARRFGDPQVFIGAVIVAPFVEEAAKALGVRPGRPATQTWADGLVYGAAAGLGFSATENLLNGVIALYSEGGGPEASLAVIAVRSFSSSFLHASATAVTGYGIAKTWLTLRPTAFLPFYMTAVTMHASFNFLVVAGPLYFQQYGDMAELIVLAAAAGFAVVAITVVRLKLATHRPAVRR